MSKRVQSTAESRTALYNCPVEGCQAGPFRSDKLYGKGGHLEKMAAKGDANHELALDGSVGA
jgi:hypothetical protein